MTRLAQALIVALTFAIGFPLAVIVIGASAEHFLGQDGDQ